MWLRRALHASLGILSPRLVINLLRAPRKADSRPALWEARGIKAPSSAQYTMGDRSNRTEDSTLAEEDDITVVSHKVAPNGSDSGDDHDELGGQGERTAERIHLQRRESGDRDDDDAGRTRREAGGDRSPEDQQRKRLCPPGCCARGEPASPPEGRGATQHQSSSCVSLS